MAPTLGSPPTPEAVHRAKLLEAQSSGTGGPLPSNVEWLRRRPPEERAAYVGAVARKPTRTLSGVAVVAVMTAPARCPHGRCTYCPGGVEARSPQSYTGEEPSALRGAQFGWDARKIAQHRVETLEAIGHPTSKIEAIIMGGTFPARPRAYQEEVLRGLYNGLNGTDFGTLAEARERNAGAERRVVGLTVETRPDWCDGRVLPFLLEAGVTRLELGVECLHPDVLAAVGRAHGVEEVARATREARDRGFKVGYHLMLGLPGMDPERDLEDFRRLWEDEAYRPDFLKLYPTLVLPGTELFDAWKAGRYEPYRTETACEVLAAMKKVLPPWVRIHRIQRDIPARLIAAGVRASNLRQLALARLAAEGRRCRCLRCREPGRSAQPAPGEFGLVENEYRAAGGQERFLAFEESSTDTVAGYLRLRFPSAEAEDGRDRPIVRELKVVGRELPVGASPGSAAEYQHRGFGRRLLARAEEIARGEGFRRLWVISAVGARAYYARQGYGRDGPYMAKSLAGL
jgi:elongator complex protein 3